MLFGVFCLFFLSKLFFWENSFRNTIKCQTVWIQIRPDVWSIMIWVQAVCKVYQQKTLVGKESKRSFLTTKIKVKYKRKIKL